MSVPASLHIPALTASQAVAAADMAAVDALIRRRLASDVVLINQVAEHIVAAGGKRLRPMLLLLAARALGHQGTDAHQLAAVVEFIHTSTLLHDDVEIGRAHVRTPVTNAHLVCRLLLEKK